MRYLEVDTPTRWSSIGLGTWQFGSREWGYGSDYASGEAAAIVKRALELGVTFYDTAEVYGSGRSERILGRALRDAGVDRAEVSVATKIFPVLPLAPVVEQRGVASAARLEVAPIDLYQVHQPNPVVRDGTTMRGMRALRSAGVVREVGVSNYGLDRWKAAEEQLGSRVLSNQVQYSLVHRDPEDDLVPHARERGRVVIAYSPLAQGLLSGKYGVDNRPRSGVRAFNLHFLPENLERSRPLLDTLREVADAHDAAPAQVALAWVVRDPHVLAIPGASSVEQLESNAAAGDLVLAGDEVDALTAAARAYHPRTGAGAVVSGLRARFAG